MKNLHFDNFWQSIHLRAKERGTLLRVMFELTYKCNFKCGHCFVPFNYRKKRELKTKEVIYILEQLKNIGCFYLGFTGGELFMRKDIMDILWHAKRCGFEIIIYSNGSLINKRIAEELSVLRPNKIDITIPAMTRQPFEKITRTKGSHERVFKAIELLQKKGINLGFKTCLLKENKQEIKQIKDFAAALGASHRLDDVLSRRLDGSDEPYRYRGEIAKGAFSKIGRAVRIENKQDSADCGVTDEAVNENLFPCGTGQCQAAITALGELKMCVMADYPKYKVRSSETKAQSRDMSLEEAWKRLKELVSSIKPDDNYSCNKCELQPFCKWCPARSWLESRNFTSCTSESRRWAQMRSRQLESITNA